MKLLIRKQVKFLLMQEGMTLTELATKLRERTGGAIFFTEFIT